MSAQLDEFSKRWIHDVCTPGADIEALEQELMAVHATSASEEDRVRLIRLHISFINRVARNLAATKPEMVMPLMRHSLSRYHLMLREESLSDGVLDRSKLLRVTERELLSGRMKADDPLRTYAEGGDYIFGHDMAGIYVEGERDQPRSGKDLN